MGEVSSIALPAETGKCAVFEKSNDGKLQDNQRGTERKRLN
jgi:hypothetical protein